MAIKRNKVVDPNKKESPIKRIYVRGKENITSSNIAKKPKVNKIIDPKETRTHGKPLKRVMRTSIQALKKEETSNTQNKKIWLKKTTNATGNKIKKASSLNLVKNISIAQKKIKVTKK